MCKGNPIDIRKTIFDNRYFCVGICCFATAVYFGCDSLLPHGPTTINSEYSEYDPAFPNISAAAASLGFSVAGGFCMIASVAYQILMRRDHQAESDSASPARKKK